MRHPPIWDPMQIHTIMLVPIPTARMMLWQYCHDTLVCFFCLTDQIRYPIGFCAQTTFLFDILRYSGCTDIITYATRIDISKPYDDTDLVALYHVVNHSMDATLASWRASNPPPDPIWSRYLQIVESFGPYGEESWLTVHLSFMWLLDWFFLTPSTISYSTNKFRRQWRLMTKIRRGLSNSILLRRKYSSPPYLPPKSKVDLEHMVLATSTMTLTFPSNESSKADDPSFSSCVFTPTENIEVTPSFSLVMPLPSRHRRYKKRRRKRRMDFYKRYYRLPPPPKIPQLPLADTAIPDLHRSRSAGSYNIKDPPMLQGLCFS